MLTGSKSVLRGEVNSLAGIEAGLVDEVAGMRKDCDLTAEDALFERDSLEVRLHLKASQLSGFGNSWKVASERPEQHRGRLAARFCGLRLCVHPGFQASLIGWLSG